MTASPVSIPINPLPRDIDVSITINRPQTELASDLSLLCFVTPDLDFAPNNSRVRVYSTFDSLIQDTGWTPENTGYWAAQAFFSQTVRPPRMAIGRVFESDVPAQLMGGVITNYASLGVVSDGAFNIAVEDSSGTPAIINVEGIDLTGASSVDAIVTAINAALAAGNQNTQLIAENEYGGRLVLNAIGGNVRLGFAESPSTGTDISELLNLTQASGAQKWDAYEPAGLVSEVQLVASAARVGGYPVFAWALDRKYRDTQDQRLVSDWAETQGFKAWAVQCTNLPTAYDSADTTNLAYYAMNLAYKSTSVQYSSNPLYYPEIAYAMQTLSTDYTGTNTVATACFNDASGIPPEDITETKLSVLESRNCNVFVRVGNNARTQRYGTQSAPTWWTDSYAGACNFREALQVAAANVLYRNRTVPYTARGQNMIVSAIGSVCDQFVNNGYLAEREIADSILETGVTTVGAYVIAPTPIYRATETQRASRILPPIAIAVYEAGAIHHVSVTVELVN